MDNLVRACGSSVLLSIDSGADEDAPIDDSGATFFLGQQNACMPHLESFHCLSGWPMAEKQNRLHPAEGTRNIAELIEPRLAKKPSGVNAFYACMAAQPSQALAAVTGCTVDHWAFGGK